MIASVQRVQSRNVLRTEEPSAAVKKDTMSIEKTDNPLEEVKGLRDSRQSPSKAKTGGQSRCSGGQSRCSVPCLLTEQQLLTVQWQQGSNLHTALKSLARFLFFVNVVEVVEKEDSDEVIFRIAEKKKFSKQLKIYSKNSTNSLDKLRSSTPRLTLTASEANENMFGLNISKKKENNEFLKKMMTKYPGVKIEEKTHVRIFWMASKLDYFKALTDKTLNVKFVPSIQNYQEMEPLSEVCDATKHPADSVMEPYDVIAKEDPEVKNENDRNLTTSEDLHLTENAVFYFIWQNLNEHLKMRKEHMISHQLTDFIKTVQCSKITNGEDGLKFHFSCQGDVNAVLTKYCPEFVGNQQRLNSLTRSFKLTPFKELYGVFSPMRIRLQDFKSVGNGKLFYSSLWFTNKMDVIRVLRDETICSLYPALYIDCRNIAVLQTSGATSPLTSSQITPVTRNFQSRHPHNNSGFGGNFSFPQLVVRGRGARSEAIMHLQAQNSSKRPSQSRSLIDRAQFRNRTAEQI